MRLYLIAILGMGTAFLNAPLMTLRQGAGNADFAEAGSKFRAYLQADWKRWMEEYPETATQVGYPGQDARWTDDSPAGIERRKRHLAESIDDLKQFQRDALPEKEKLNFDLYAQLLEESQEGLQYGDDPFPFRSVVPDNMWMPINQMEGIQQDAPDVLTTTPHRSVADYEIILKRMQALPVAVEQNIALLQEGVKHGTPRQKSRCAMCLSRSRT